MQQCEFSDKSSVLTDVSELKSVDERCRMNAYLDFGEKILLFWGKDSTCHNLNGKKL